MLFLKNKEVIILTSPVTVQRKAVFHLDRVLIPKIRPLKRGSFSKKRLDSTENTNLHEPMGKKWVGYGRFGTYQFKMYKVYCCIIYGVRGRLEIDSIQ